MLKKIICFVISCTLLLTSTFAIGDSNIDSDDGNMGGGSSGNSWSSGQEGVRVTVLDATTGAQITTPIDYTNVKPNDVAAHFGKVSKQQYKRGVSLTSSLTKYTFKNPTEPIPRIISSSSGNANIEALKRYFGDKGFLEYHATNTGISYDNLISGKYKILLEPVAYLTYGGFKFAMTATEGALYNVKTNQDLKSKMGSLTHQNLPLSMFLTTPDLGFPAWGGTSSSRVTDSQIGTSLGLGIISFKELPEEPDSDGTNILHYTYRTNTEVISSVTVYSSSEISPDDNAYVTFNINGKTYKKQFVAPANSEQLVWIKWNTPSTPQDISISVSTTNGRLETSALNCKIEELTENTPPDPTSHDTNSSFRVTNPPSKSSLKSLSWYEWWAYWKEHWVWKSQPCDDSHPEDCVGGHGRWIDEGYWIYDKNDYTANLVTRSSLRPDDDVRTNTMRAGTHEMKSGYGVEVEIISNRNSNATNYDTTEPQNAMSFFPEFKFETYNRLLTKENKTFVFTPNKYSFTNQNCHYTPLWYPDDAKYPVQSVVFDMWTPAGQLYSYVDDFIYIDGNVYDDYSIVKVHPSDPDYSVD